MLRYAAASGLAKHADGRLPLQAVRNLCPAPVFRVAIPGLMEYTDAVAPVRGPSAGIRGLSGMASGGFLRCYAGMKYTGGLEKNERTADET